jgi:hypothetical protein
MIAATRIGPPEHAGFVAVNTRMAQPDGVDGLRQRVGVARGDRAAVGAVSEPGRNQTERTIGGVSAM